MKKKLVIGLLAIVAFFIITGCDDNKQVSKDFKFNDETFKFNKKETFKEFSYNTAEQLIKDEGSKTLSLKYGKDYENVKYAFNITLTVYENRKASDIEGIPTETNTKEVNGISWKNYSKTADWTSTIFYVTEKNNNVYIINIIKNNKTDVDLDNLAEVFINGVTLK